MDGFLLFLGETILISLSGVMAPGPVTAVTVGEGSKSPHAGAAIAVGHGLVEVPLIAALMVGFGHVVRIAWVEALIALLGGTFLLYMGGDLLKSFRTADVGFRKGAHAPLVEGMLLSAGNPYFLIWWAAVGITLINRAQSFGAPGIVVFVFVHWLCDFVWLYFLSAAAGSGGKLLGERFTRVVFLVCGVVLIGFGIRFLVDGVVRLRVGASM